MPNHKSCVKRVKTSEAARLRNRGVRSILRNAIKELKAESNKEEAAKKFLIVSSLLDKAAGRNLIHSKNADRHKSRLAKFVASVG